MEKREILISVICTFMCINVMRRMLSAPGTDRTMTPFWNDGDASGNSVNWLKGNLITMNCDQAQRFNMFVTKFMQYEPYMRNHTMTIRLFRALWMANEGTIHS